MLEILMSLIRIFMLTGMSLNHQEMIAVPLASGAKFLLERR
jgi:biopolymer transport protein ExbD